MSADTAAADPDTPATVNHRTCAWQATDVLMDVATKLDDRFPVTLSVRTGTIRNPAGSIEVQIHGPSLFDEAEALAGKLGLTEYEKLHGIHDWNGRIDNIPAQVSWVDRAEDDQ